MARTMKFKVGQRVWLFSENRHVYPKGSGPRSGPIYAEHFEPNVVKAIEGRSYTIGREGSTWGDNKYGFARAEGLFKTDAEREADIWIWQHRYEITRAVERCRDAELLRRVADVMGMQLAAGAAT